MKSRKSRDPAKVGRPPRHKGERLSKNRTFRVRGGLDARLQRAAAKAGRSVSEEIEWRLEQSFDLVNTASLIRAFAGGEFIADVLAAIAKVFDLGGDWKRYPDKSEAAQVRREAAYIALILIFTELFSTPEHPLDPAPAAPLIKARRGQGGSIIDVTTSQSEALTMSFSVLKKVGYPSVFIASDEDPSKRGFLSFPERKKDEIK